MAKVVGIEKCGYEKYPNAVRYHLASSAENVEGSRTYQIWCKDIKQIDGKNIKVGDDIPIEFDYGHKNFTFAYNHKTF